MHGPAGHVAHGLAYSVVGPQTTGNTEPEEDNQKEGCNDCPSHNSHTIVSGAGTRTFAQSASVVRLGTRLRARVSMSSEAPSDEEENGSVTEILELFQESSTSPTIPDEPLATPLLSRPGSSHHSIAMELNGVPYGQGDLDGIDIEELLSGELYGVQDDDLSLDGEWYGSTQFQAGGHDDNVEDCSGDADEPPRKMQRLDPELDQDNVDSPCSGGAPKLNTQSTGLGLSTYANSSLVSGLSSGFKTRNPSSGIRLFPDCVSAWKVDRIVRTISPWAISLTPALNSGGLIIRTELIYEFPYNYKHPISIFELKQVGL